MLSGHGSSFTIQLRHQIPIEIFVGVTLWTVGGQIKQSNALLVRLHPLLDRSAVMNSQMAAQFLFCKS